MNAFVYASPWPGLLVWAALYASDFLLTMTCARLYRRGAEEHMSFGGSYEITPRFQSDVNNLRMLSPRFFMALGISCLLVYLLWQVSQLIASPEAYSFALGSLVLVQLTIHVRHLRNFYLFRAALRPGAVRGHIAYGRGIVLTLSSVELMASAGVFLIAFLVTSSWFLLGGAFSCALVGGQHLALARREGARDVPASPGPAGA